jgi:hypothetical protein
MTMPTTLGDVIAVRRLELAQDPVIRIEVKIGRPVSDGEGCYCPYQIVGIGNEKVRYAAGVDSVQVLI